MKVEYVVPFCRDGGVVCMYDEQVFTDILAANTFLSRGRCECKGNGAVNNGWKGGPRLPFNEVTVRLVPDGS